MHRASKLIYCQLQQFHTSLVFLPKVPTPGFVWLPKSQFSTPKEKKAQRNFLFLTTSVGLKIIRLKANTIYLIFKSYAIGEGQGKGGSWLWNVWKRLAMLALEGSGTGLPPSMQLVHAIVISIYKLTSPKYICIHSLHMLLICWCLRMLQSDYFTSVGCWYSRVFLVQQYCTKQDLTL